MTPDSDESSDAGKAKEPQPDKFGFPLFKGDHVFYILGGKGRIIQIREVLGFEESGVITKPIKQSSYGGLFEDYRWSFRKGKPIRSHTLIKTTLAQLDAVSIDL